MILSLITANCPNYMIFVVCNYVLWNRLLLKILHRMDIVNFQINEKYLFRFSVCFIFFKSNPMFFPNSKSTLTLCPHSKISYLKILNIWCIFHVFNFLSLLFLFDHTKSFLLWKTGKRKKFNTEEQGLSFSWSDKVSMAVNLLFQIQAQVQVFKFKCLMKALKTKFT